MESHVNDIGWMINGLTSRPIAGNTSYSCDRKLMRSPGLTVLCLLVLHEHFDMFNKSSYFIKMRHLKKKKIKKNPDFNTFLHIFMLSLVFYFLLVWKCGKISCLVFEKTLKCKMLQMSWHGWLCDDGHGVFVIAAFLLFEYPQNTQKTWHVKKKK